MPFPNNWTSGEKITASKLNSWNEKLSGFEKLSSTAAAARVAAVGFGTDAPQHPVHVNTTEAWKGFRADRNGNQFFAAYNDTAGNGEMVLFSAAGQNNVLLRAGGASYFNGGNLGVGTTSPSARLHVRNDNDALAAFQVNRGNHLLFSAYFNQSSSISEFVFGDGSGGVAALVNGQGVMGIKTADMSPVPGTPTPPPVSSNAKIYVRNGKLIVQYNDAGTVRYKWLDLTGTGVTWQHSTTAP